MFQISYNGLKILTGSLQKQLSVPKKSLHWAFGPSQRRRRGRTAVLRLLYPTNRKKATAPANLRPHLPQGLRTGKSWIIIRLDQKRDQDHPGPGLCERIITAGRGKMPRPREQEVTDMQSDYLSCALRQLEALVAIPSPTGFTERVVDYCIGEFAAMGYAPKRTAKGGLTVELGGTGDGLLLSAHVDTLGAMVCGVKPGGALRVAPVGGLRAQNIEAETARVYTRSGRVLEGTFQLENASVHVNSEYDKTQRGFDTIELLLDEKTRSEQQTRALGVAAGDYVAVAPRFAVTQTGYIKSRFLDDKLSAAILLTLARYWKDTCAAPRRRVHMMFTVFEEVGHGGASIPEDVTEMIAVDMGCVGKGLQCDETMVSICAMDSRGPSHKAVVDGLVDAAQRAGVRYALDVYPHYGSDADAAVCAGHEVRHCVVGPGVYASHGYERAHIEGLANTFDLLRAYLGI